MMKTMWITMTTYRSKSAFIALSIIATLLITSCASGSSADTAEEIPAVPVAAVPAEPATTIAVTMKKTGNFYLSDASVLADIETGTPESLRLAVSKLKRTDDNYSDDEATLILIASAIMSSVWPQQKATWTNPSRQPVNGYTEILNSIRQGVYDGPSDVSGADFLSLTLPSLLLCANTTSTSWLEESAAHLAAAAALNPDSALVPVLQCRLFERQGNTEQALRCAERVYALTPDSYEASFQYAELLNKTGRSAEALVLAQKMYAKDSYSMALLKLCAAAAWAAKDIEQADTYVAQVLQREPDNEEFLLLRAGILYSRGEYLNASSLLDAYSKRDTNSRDYLVLRTRLYQNWTRNNNAALATISQALALYSDDSEVLLLATEIAMATSLPVNGKTGRQLLEQLEKADPDNRLTLQLLVNQAVLEENWEKAYQSSVALVPEGSLENQLTHISICLNTNHIVEAESLIMKLYELHPENESVQQQYIRVLIASGRSAQALVLIEKLLPDAQGKEKSALYYEKSRLESSKDKQLADLRSSLTANPRNQDALFSLYEYYFDKNDYRKAQYYLKQLIALNSGNTRYLALNTQLDSLVNTRN